MSLPYVASGLSYCRTWYQSRSKSKPPVLVQALLAGRLAALLGPRNPGTGSEPRAKPALARPPRPGSVNHRPSILPTESNLNSRSSSLSHSGVAFAPFPPLRVVLLPIIHVDPTVYASSPLRRHSVSCLTAPVLPSRLANFATCLEAGARAQATRSLVRGARRGPQSQSHPSAVAEQVRPGPAPIDPAVPSLLRYPVCVPSHGA